MLTVVACGLLGVGLGLLLCSSLDLICQAVLDRVAFPRTGVPAKSTIPERSPTAWLGRAVKPRSRAAVHRRRRA